MTGPAETTLDGIRDIRVYQNRNGYRFSVDALLLYSFVNVRHVRSIVDLGAGSGIVGLLLARKYGKARVTLVEVQDSLLRLASRNISLNGLDERVRAVKADIARPGEALEPESCDVAVSNPPFRRTLSGRLSVGEEKAVARHEIRMDVDSLARTASYLLRAKGRFFMIFLPERIVELFVTLRRHSLEPKRIRFVHNDPAALSKMVLIESVKNGRGGAKIEKPLVLYKKNGEYTDEVLEYYGRGPVT